MGGRGVASRLSQLFPIEPPKSEADIRNEIRAMLEREFGLKSWRVDTTFGSRARNSSTKGWPDLFGIIAPEGRLWAVETKRPRARVQRHEDRQKDVQDELRRSGALVVVARSVAEVRAAFIAAGVPRVVAA